MTRIGKAGVQLAVSEDPGAKREPLVDVAVRRKEVLVARSVIDEVRRRVVQFRGGDLNTERERGKENEKARAAAWAWYQHGKGGKESVPTSGVGGASTLAGRFGGSTASAHKSSRFKTEALKTTGNPDSRIEPADTSGFPTSQASSLFDSYELDSVSKRIDNAFNADATPSTLQPPVPATPKIARSSSLRMQFPRSICRSISDVVTREEMALGVDIRKCDCHRNRQAGRGSSWSFRRLSRAIQGLMHLPECEYHPQQQHVEHRQAREHHHEHHHHHQHEHEHHHHIHYQVKLRDGTHYGKSFTTFPGESDLLGESPREKDHQLFSRLSPRLSP